MKTSVYLLPHPTKFFLELESIQTDVTEKIKTHFMFNHLFPENLEIYEIMWKNIIHPIRPYENMKHALCILHN